MGTRQFRSGHGGSIAVPFERSAAEVAAMREAAELGRALDEDPSAREALGKRIRAMANRHAVTPARDPDWWDGFRAGHTADRNENQIVQWFSPPIRTGRLTLIALAVLAAVAFAARVFA